MARIEARFFEDVFRAKKIQARPDERAFDVKLLASVITG